MAAEAKTLHEVLVSDKAKNEAVTSAQMGRENLNVKQLASLPVLFGEKDVMKIVQLLPGVKAAGEGSAGFYVRGGGADQNLVLLDEAIVYNPSHLLSFFSVFNSDAIKSLALYKGNEPAQYGGRLSSVMDVKMNDGNDQSYHASGGIGLIAARLNVEGPIVKSKGSFLVSARRTYADAFLGLSGDSAVRNNRLYFYDLNAKLNYKITDRDRVYLSGYHGKDILSFGDVVRIDWGNATATLRWNHIFSSKLFSNTSLIYSDYRYKVRVNTAGVNGNMLSSIQDWNFKRGFDYYLNTNHSLHFGFNVIHHSIAPGFISARFAISDSANSKTWENAIYISDSWKASPRLNIDIGARLSSFLVLGGNSQFYTLDDNREIVDTLQFSSRHVFKTYLNFEPRISASYRLGNASSVKAAYTRNAQYLHLYSNFLPSNPIDKLSKKWTVSADFVYNTGNAATFPSGKYEVDDQAIPYYNGRNEYRRPAYHRLDVGATVKLKERKRFSPELSFSIYNAYGRQNA